MIRYALALGITLVWLFGMDGWAAWLTDTQPLVRNFALSDTFAIALGAGVGVVIALVVMLTRPSGRTGSEDHEEMISGPTSEDL